MTSLDSGTAGRRLESRFNGRSICLLAASFLCLVCSLLSKATLVTLPFVFLLLDFWPLGRRTEGWVRLAVEKTPFFLLTVAFSVVAAVAQRGSHSVAALDAVSFPTRCANALAAYAAYLGHTVVPFHLAIYYPHPGERLSIGTVGLAVVLLTVISLFVVASRRRFPFVFVGWAWYLGTLVPMIGLVQIGTQQMADRYTYFPLIGIFVGVTWLIGALALTRSVPERVAGWGAAGLLVALGSAAFVQVSYWRDNVTLFRHAVESTGENPLAEVRSVMPSCCADKGRQELPIWKPRHRRGRMTRKSTTSWPWLCKGLVASMRRRSITSGRWLSMTTMPRPTRIWRLS